MIASSVFSDHNQKPKPERAQKVSKHLGTKQQAAKQALDKQEASEELYKHTWLTENENTKQQTLCPILEVQLGENFKLAITSEKKTKD